MLAWPSRWDKDRKILDGALLHMVSHIVDCASHLNAGTLNNIVDKAFAFSSSNVGRAKILHWTRSEVTVSSESSFPDNFYSRLRMLARYQYRRKFGQVPRSSEASSARLFCSAAGLVSMSSMTNRHHFIESTVQSAR